VSPGAGELDALFDRLDYPMLIVTAVNGAEQAGCLVGFSTQCSLDPVRYIVCISKANRTYRVAAGTSHLAVHFVPKAALGLARLFGGSTGDDIDKFANCDWTEGPHGLPVLDGCPDNFVGRVEAEVDSGDHVAFHLEPEQWSTERDTPLLMFRDARDIEAGHPA
jgi:flavin reductase (DIM6/NTAB) family NADH-FMN oxidoreductase RutF